MGVGSSRDEVVRRDCGVRHDMQQSGLAIESKGRVRCLCACTQSGVVLASVGTDVHSWTLDGVFFRSFNIGYATSCLTESPGGEFFYAGVDEDAARLVARVRLTKRTALAPFERQEDGEEQFLKFYTIEATEEHTETPLLSLLRPYVVTEAVTRIAFYEEETALLCCAPHVVLYDFATSTSLRQFHNAYPSESSPFDIYLPSVGRSFLRHPCIFSALRQRIYSSNIISGKQEVLTLNLAMEAIGVLKVVGNALVLGVGGEVVKYNLLASQCVWRARCEGIVRNVLDGGGLLYVVSEKSRAVEVLSRKTGRRVGRYTTSFTPLLPASLQILQRYLFLADLPHAGHGFKTLIKRFDLATWFVHSPWIPHLPEGPGYPDVTPSRPPLMDAVLCVGQLAVEISQPKTELRIGDNESLLQEEGEGEEEEEEEGEGVAGPVRKVFLTQGEI